MKLSTDRDQECSYTEVPRDLLLGQGHLERTVIEGACLRPVLVALLPVAFSEVGQHDDGGGPLLPHQPPKVHDGFWLGTCHIHQLIMLRRREWRNLATLSCYEFMLL